MRPQVTCTSWASGGVISRRWLPRRAGCGLAGRREGGGVQFSFKVDGLKPVEHGVLSRWIILDSFLYLVAGFGSTCANR